MAMAWIIRINLYDLWIWKSTFEIHQKYVESVKSVCTPEPQGLFVNTIIFSLPQSNDPTCPPLPFYC
jgi:hypothetical protein